MSLGDHPPILVGRTTELDVMHELLEAARTGSGHVLLIEGEAGIGKTRLTQEAAAAASSRGFNVVRAACDTVASSRPFKPIADALDVIEDAEDPERAKIGALLAKEDPHSATPITAGTHFRVVAGLEGLIERLASTQPLMLVVEDLHWADVSTLVVLRSVARRVDRLPILVVGTHRSGHSLTELHGLSDEVLRAGGHRLRLGPLDDPSVADLAAELLGAPPSRALLDRMRGAAGNPLFVTELARTLLIERGIDIHDGTAELREGGLPLEFRLTVHRRLGQLSAAANDQLRMASVLGSIFSPADLAVVSGTDPVALAALLQEAADAGVIEEREHSLAFTHDLVRDAVYEGIPAPVRRQLHREFGRSLAKADGRPLVVSHHLVLGAEDRDPEAAEWLRRAARDVATRAPAVAVELLEQARSLQGPADPERDALLAELVMPLAWSGRLAEAEATAREVLPRNPSPSVAGAIRCGLVYAAAWQGRPAEALQYVADVQEELTEQDSTLLRAHAAAARMFSFDLSGAADDARAAVDAANASGHELALCTALGVQAWLGAFSGDTAHAIDAGFKALAIADRDPTGEAHLANARFFLGMPLLAVDRLDDAESVLQDGRRIAEELGHAWGLPLYHAFLGTKRFISGDWDDAIAEFETSLEIADEVGMTMGALVAACGWLAVIRVHRDEIEKAEQSVARAQRRVAEQGPQTGMSVLAWAKALVLEARGNMTGAIDVLRSAWDLNVAAGLEAEPWSGAALVRLCSRAGEPERAEGVVPVIEAQGARSGTPFMRGRAVGCRGLLSSDPDLLLRAVDLYRQCPRPHELALACEDAAVALAAQGRTQEAIPLFDEAIQGYAALAATRDIARARAALRRVGVTRGSRQPRARATAGWDSLTKTELKVVALVAQRLSNPEIAGRLYISRHTVESHLKHIYAKLGLRSRVALVEEASRRATGAPVG